MWVSLIRLYFILVSKLFSEAATSPNYSPKTPSAHHQRSQSDLPPISPQLDGATPPDRNGSTATITMSSESYLARNSLASSSSRAPSVHDKRPSSEPSLPKTTLRPIPLQATRANAPVSRQRQSISPDLSQNTPPSFAPPAIPTAATSAASRAALVDMERAQVVEATTARLAERPRAPIDSSPVMQPYSVVKPVPHYRSTTEDEVLAKGRPRSLMRSDSRDEALSTVRPGSSTAVYPEEINGSASATATVRLGSATVAYRRPPTSQDTVTEMQDYSQRPPARQTSIRRFRSPSPPPIQDENNYNPHARSQITSSSVTPSYSNQHTARPVLGESNRGNHTLTQNSNNTQQPLARKQYSSQMEEYQVPLRDASPDVTPQVSQPYYVSNGLAQHQQQQQQQQQEQQQQQRQQQQYQQQMQQPMIGQQQQQQYAVPPPPIKTKPSGITVSNDQLPHNFFMY